MVCIVAVMLIVAPHAGGQGLFELDEGELGEMVASAQEWAKENLDEDAVKLLPETEREQVEKFLKQFQEQLKGQYVLDLAALKDAAKIVRDTLDGFGP